MADTPTSASLPDPSPQQVASTISHPRPLQSLIASAQRITSRTVTTRAGTTAQGWQDDAWEMFDLVGEQRFLATTLANRLAQAVLYVGKVPEDPMEDPVPVEDGPAVDALDSFGKHAGGRGQLIARLAVNLFVAGDSWLVGIPTYLLPASQRSDATDVATGPDGELIEPPPEDFAPSQSLDELEWRALSVSEVSWEQERVTLMLGETREEKVTAPPDQLFLIRVWRPHPRRWWQADSPTRSSLPVLRELVGLTMHISAQVDSRLAGAGILVVPQSAKTAILVSMGRDPNTTDDDPFTEALMEAMLTPISDRSNASAIVPLVITVPDDAVDKFNHITFSAPLDAEARELRDEAIRRLALGQDCPPELLLGVAGMNHWGAWLVREDVVTTHIEPPLALMCDALTTQFLWPVLIESGMAVEQAHEYVIWYDVSHMVLRPNRTQDAFALHEAGVIDDDALRDAAGFGDADAPPASDPVIAAVLKLINSEPDLIVTPGVDFLTTQMTKLLTGQTTDTDTPVAGSEEAAPVEDPTTDDTADDTTADDLPADGGEGDGTPGSDSIAAAAAVAAAPPYRTRTNGHVRHVPRPDNPDARPVETINTI